MEPTLAFQIIRTLAQGTNPTTGEKFPADSPYNHPDIIRALFVLLGRVPTQKKSVEERRQENLEKGLPPNTGLPWSDEARQAVAEVYRAGQSIQDLATAHQRTKGAIVAELVRQNVIGPDEASKLIGGYRFRGAQMEAKH